MVEGAKMDGWRGSEDGIEGNAPIGGWIVRVRRPSIRERRKRRGGDMDEDGWMRKSTSQHGIMGCHTPTSMGQEDIRKEDEQHNTG